MESLQTLAQHQRSNAEMHILLYLAIELLREEVASGGLRSYHSLLAKLNILPNKQQPSGALSEFIMASPSRNNGKRGQLSIVSD